MENMVAVGRSLPISALAPALVVTFAIMLFGFRNVRSISVHFIGWAIYLRFVGGALHDFTFQRSPLGLSYNAILSVMICLVGFCVVRKRSLSDASILPFSPLVILIIGSGIANSAYSELITEITKYVYLIIMVMAAVDAFESAEPNRILRLILLPFALPFILQVMSVLLHMPKPGETDGADSYIGGYNHEAAFSIILLAAVLVVCFVKDIRLSNKLGMIAYGFFAIVLANYRTAILSVLPLVVTSVLVAVPRVVIAKQRILVISGVILAVVGLFVAGIVVGSDRFTDLGTVSQEQEYGSLIKRPDTFSPTERRVLSGRAYIWSMYYYGWADAPLKQKVIGYGAGTWSNVFSVYAHNTLVSALYELGVGGVLATLFMWLSMLVIAIVAKAGPRLELLAAHASFVILNMATMPLWQIEGMILYAVLCGYTIHCFIMTRRLAENVRKSGY